MTGRHTRARTYFRRRAAALLLLAVLLVLLVPGVLAQDAAPESAPAAPTAATLTLGKTTTPAGGLDFRLTALSYQGFWGRGTANSGTYRQPRDIAVDATGNFYVTDHRNSRVTKLSPAGKLLLQIGGPGRQPSNLLRPNAIAISGTTLAVADTENNRIAFYNTTNGSFIRWLGAQGTGNGQFDRPNGVAYDAAGNLYVADTWNHRIQVFNASLTYLRQWGTLGSGAGQFRFPAHLDLDATGNVYVSDSNNHRLQVFTGNGVFVRQIGSVGNAPGQFYLPVGIDVGLDSYLYVSDTYNNRVQKLTTDGTFVAQWNQAGASTISRPNGLLALGALVYVSDIDANRVQRYSQGTVTLDHGEQRAFPLPAGTYDITEAAKSGWTFGSATCTGGNPSPITNGVRVTLADGASVSCGFVNTQ
ncbi:6-bladed beta-propeller [Promineifilum sp.]|uniref:6-bladed beta-propeller n=1 Tax=Promineifilum sp. TaxID=2664178 RepID=UPI0035B26FED